MCADPFPEVVTRSSGENIRDDGFSEVFGRLVVRVMVCRLAACIAAISDDGYVTFCMDLTATVAVASCLLAAILASGLPTDLARDSPLT